MRPEFSNQDPPTREAIFRQNLERVRLPEDYSRENLEPALVPPTSSVEGLAKTAAVLGAGYLLFRGIGPRNTIRGLHGIGEIGRGVKESLINPVEDLVNRAILGGTSSGVRRLGNIATPDLVEEISQIYRKYGADPTSISRSHGTRTGVQLHRDFLSQRYVGGRPGSVAKVTVGDVFSSVDLQRRLGSEQFDMLNRARNQGLISNEMALSKGNLTGLFKRPSGGIYDTQWANPIRLFDAAHKGLRQFQLAGLRPADLIFGAIRPMIADSDHHTIGMGMTLPNGVRTGRGLNISLGGNIYGQNASGGFNLLATGTQVYDVSRPGSQFYARALSAMDGTLANQANDRLRARIVAGHHPFRQFFQRMQDAVGVGPEFATSKSLIPGQLLDAARRRRIIRTHVGGDWVPNAYVPYRSTLTSPEIVRETARVEAGQAIFNGNVVSDVDAWLDRAVPAPAGFSNFANMPLEERLKAYAGKSRAGDFYEIPPSHATGFPGHKIGHVPNERRPMQGFTPVDPSMPPPVGPRGVPAGSVPATGVVGEAGFGNTAHLFMHHMTERLNTLMGQTMGVGFRPSPGKWGWVNNFGKIYGMAAASKIALEYGKYADYLAGEALDVIPGLDDTTPSEYIVKAARGSLIARQKLREKIGVQKMAEYMEGLMPGSWSLPGSWIARTVLPPALGAYRGGRYGAMAGGVVSAVLGGSDVDMSSGEMEQILTGKKDVPVYNSRWWALGLQSWRGDKISYYRPHWMARYLSNYRYTDSQYGSKAEYFAFGSAAPTPHNLFGILPIADPDYYARKHEADRPYPFSPSGVQMHEGGDYMPMSSLSTFNAAALGYQTSPGGYSQGIDPSSIGGLARRTTDRVTEMFGLYKFLAEQIPGYDSVFGSGPQEDMYAATASTITSGSREYYDESFGGMLGMSELLRRYLDPQKGKQGINRIPNTMPSWMPGARSMFPGDRDYYTDFTLGDPYASVPLGEARLPGEGYEAIHRLHSNVPGVYDAYDAYRILADVAPYSDAFKNFRTIVEAWAASGMLDKSWMEDYQNVEKQVTSIMDGPEFTPRRFSGVRSGTLEELATVNKYSVPERVIGAGWEHLTHDIVPGIGKSIPIFGTMFDRKILGQRSAYESFLESQVYGTDFQNWETPYESFVKPAIKETIAANPLTAIAGGASLGTLFGATPFGAAMSAVGAVGLGGASIGRAVVTGEWSGGWVPGEYKERMELETYFDSLQYARAERNKGLASKTGNSALAYQFSREMERTGVGFNYDLNGAAFYGSAKFRLGGSMKNYAWQFLQAPEETRNKIMQFAPEMAAPILSSAYSRQGDRRYGFRPTGSARDMANSRINKFGMPASDWGGWSPDVPMDIIKVRTLDSYHNEAWDMHRHNLWESDRSSAQRSYANLGSAF